MSRISKKKKVELLEALYNSSDDEDDDLLNTDIHLQTSQRSPGSSINDLALSQTSTSASSAGTVLPVPAPVDSKLQKQQFEEKGKKRLRRRESNHSRHKTGCLTVCFVYSCPTFLPFSLSPSFSLSSPPSLSLSFSLCPSFSLSLI